MEVHEVSKRVYIHIHILCSTIQPVWFGYVWLLIGLGFFSAPRNRQPTTIVLRIAFKFSWVKIIETSTTWPPSTGWKHHVSNMKPALRPGMVSDIKSWAKPPNDIPPMPIFASWWHGMSILFGGWHGGNPKCNSWFLEAAGEGCPIGS